VTTSRPIGPYQRRQLAVRPWDPAIHEAAARVVALIQAKRPDLVVHHTGSTAVPGLPGKGVLDLGIHAEPDDIPGITRALYELGFGPQTGADPWPPTRPMLIGSVDVEGAVFNIHCHVIPDRAEFEADLAFRDALRADPDLMDDYARLKTSIIAAGPAGSLDYTNRKAAWISDVLRRIGVGRPVIEPPATIGILGGGQLGRMLGQAAVAMGYRVAVLDPDRSCPASVVADLVVVGGYGDIDAALRLAERCSVITYELEHIDASVVTSVESLRSVRPGPYPLRITQDRLAERAFIEHSGFAVAPWREIRTVDDLRVAAADDKLGLPLRVKATTGGYDGRSQIRVGTPEDVETALDRLGVAPGTPVLAESEVAFEAELSVVVARGTDGQIAAFPVARNRHDEGILVESVAPAPVSETVAAAGTAIGERLATAMGLVGTLTVELFLLRDGSLVVNELAPRVHNSGHWTIEGAATSQFEQHIRAICGLPLGSTDVLAPTAVVNVLGEGRRRPARLTGVFAALSDPDVHLHVYDKRDVFERRKMGHLTALGTDVDNALEHARNARASLAWADEPDGGDGDRDKEGDAR
jgi:5-(carboxyamino)imidazole ribonucleotide synthase